MSDTTPLTGSPMMWMVPPVGWRSPAIALRQFSLPIPVHTGDAQDLTGIHGEAEVAERRGTSVVQAAQTIDDENFLPGSVIGRGRGSKKTDRPTIISARLRGG